MWAPPRGPRPCTIGVRQVELVKVLPLLASLELGMSIPRLIKHDREHGAQSKGRTSSRPRLPRAGLSGVLCTALLSIRPLMVVGPVPSHRSTEPPSLSVVCQLCVNAAAQDAPVVLHQLTDCTSASSLPPQLGRTSKLIATQHLPTVSLIRYASAAHGFC